MGALPKRRSSKSVVRKRRVADKLKKLQLVKLTGTKKKGLPHRVNLATGLYKNKKVMKVK